jgi:predicted nucleotidyltransferase
LGRTIPTSTSLADALFPRVRQRVLAILFGNPGRSFFLSEVVALAQSGSGAVQRELASLSEAGLLNVTAQGNQKHYRANEQAPVFGELRGLVMKTFGAVDVVRAALAPIAGLIRFAFIYGSVAQLEDTAHSDIDVLVVSDDVGYGDAFRVLEAAGVDLGRKINPTIYTVADWQARLKQKNAFVTKVLKKPKLWLIGSEEDVRG